MLQIWEMLEQSLAENVMLVSGAQKEDSCDCCGPIKSKWQSDLGKAQGGCIFSQSFLQPPPLPLSWGSREGTASHHSSFWLVVFHALSIKGCCLHAGCQEESSTCILKLSPQGTVCYTPPGEEEIVLLLAKQVMLVVFKTTATGNREHRWHSHSSEIVEISPILFS